MDILINGDWSAAGTATGDHQFGGINGGWTVNDNFVYNPISHQTLFEAINRDYNGNNNGSGGNPNISFTLFGAPAAVPEPATLALLGVGLAGLGFSRRRKSQLILCATQTDPVPRGGVFAVDGEAARSYSPSLCMANW